MLVETLAHVSLPIQTNLEQIIQLIASLHEIKDNMEHVVHHDLQTDFNLNRFENDYNNWKLELKHLRLIAEQSMNLKEILSTSFITFPSMNSNNEIINKQKKHNSHVGKQLTVIILIFTVFSLVYYISNKTKRE